MKNIWKFFAGLSLFFLPIAPSFGQDLSKVIAIQQAQIMKLESEIENLKGNKDTSLPPMAQIHAQATCSALMKKSGWAFAVYRDSPKPNETCTQVCSALSEEQAGKLTCFNSIHIYSNMPSRAKETLGMKTHVYQACDTLGMGPNYCCCGN